MRLPPRNTLTGRILREMRYGLWTARGIAEVIGEPVPKISKIMSKMRRRGLLLVVGATPNGANPANLYEPSPEVEIDLDLEGDHA